MSLKKDLILATDLDGTFLDGSFEARRALLQLFNKRSPRTRLIFVTGRGVESVLPALSDPLVPDPDFIISDVGATIVQGSRLDPYYPLMAEITENWPGHRAVMEALKPFDFLQRQEAPQERRCSFFCQEGQITDELRRVVEEELGCDLLFSKGRYLDVLPKGVSKGSTLRRLVELEGWDEDSVVMAGDTLNDLSMLELPEFKGIAVGGSEKPLLDALKGKENVFFAKELHAAGILEGLKDYDFISEYKALKPMKQQAHGKSELVMVYHRLPFDEVREGSKMIRRRPKSPNGIIPTLLGFFSDGQPGSWVAWSQQSTREPEDFEVHVPVDEENYSGLLAARVPLTTKDVELFYKKFSKEAFWPIIFSFPDRGEFRQDHWLHYQEVNRLFAEQAAKEAAPGALVWVHDYNLWLVPGMLRQLRPDVKIAFFHHTAFPPPDVFNVLPWRREIVSSLLQCDYVGFHIPRYVENFVSVVRSHSPTTVLEFTSCAPRYLTYGCALGEDSMCTAIEVNGRKVKLGAHPVGIDMQRLTSLLQEDRVQQKIHKINDEIGDRCLILSVERLDYVKGPLEKVLAFEKLLEKRPELHGKVVMVNIVTPPAPGMEVYTATREEVDKIVGRINGRFSRLDWTPIRYFYRALPYEDVLAYYAVADVAWITPLRDGLNLVAKEYAATKGALKEIGMEIRKTAGALVLSEFAGAAVELHGAILTNPYDIDDMVETLYRGIILEEADAKHRMMRLVDIVRENDVINWGREFYDAVHRPVGETQKGAS